MNIEELNFNQIFFIDQFQTWDIEIDFNKPELIQNELIKITEEIEKECPVGKYFGVSGIGEGAVWDCEYKDNHLQFKIKGEKHSVSKVKTLASVDVEKVESIREFVSNVVTENRLKQGLDYLKQMSLEPINKNVGTFIRWCCVDIFKEESDTIISNQLDVKLISKEISNVARKWYFEQI